MVKVIRLILIAGIAIALLFLIVSALYYFGAFGPHLTLTKTNFNNLPSWQEDDQDKALQTFKQSCITILKHNPNSTFKKSIPLSGKMSHWQTICLAANQLKKSDKLTARQFFELWFEPYRVTNNFNPRGLFTGYYLPLLSGNLKRDKLYSTPIYGLPNDLIKINLRLFLPELKRTLIGQLKGHSLYPYPDRAAINNGAIRKSASVLAWIDGVVDVFFAQIQGSAIVQLPNHKQFIIGFAGDNGKPYTAIAKVLIENKALPKENASMQGIRNWLLKNPDQLNAVLNRNASYVFFRILKNMNPLGSEQVPLTPERSLAVDTHYMPLGAPIWLETTVSQNTLEQNKPFRHLLIAQDTGGAIRGIVRGDIYWGAGDRAAYIAGHLKSPGQYWILLPRRKN